MRPTSITWTAFKRKLLRPSPVVTTKSSSISLKLSNSTVVAISTTSSSGKVLLQLPMAEVRPQPLAQNFMMLSARVSDHLTISSHISAPILVQFKDLVGDGSHTTRTVKSSSSELLLTKIDLSIKVPTSFQFLPSISGSTPTTSIIETSDQTSWKKSGRLSTGPKLKRDIMLPCQHEYKKFVIENDESAEEEWIPFKCFSYASYF